MAERYKSKRVKFTRNKQRDFLFTAKNKLGLDWRELAKLLKISERNLSDWKREKITVPLNIVKIICKKANLSFPKNIELLSPYWYAKKGARKGGLAVLKKYKFIYNKASNKIMAEIKKQTKKQTKIDKNGTK